MKEPLSIPQYYTRKLKDKRPESEILKKFARKITKVPESINIPSQYFVSRKN